VPLTFTYEDHSHIGFQILIKSENKSQIRELVQNVDKRTCTAMKQNKEENVMVMGSRNY